MHIVIVQTALSYLDNRTYNRQEIGLAKALSNNGYKVSLIFAGKKKSIENVCNNVDIYYLKCYKLNQQIGIYRNLWQTLDFLHPDLLQIHEIGMFMSYYAFKWSQSRNIKCVLIQGPYELTRKIFFKQFEFLFDKLFGTYILKHIAGVGCKTEAATTFLKGFYNRSYLPTPVGLDESRFFIKENNVDIKAQYGINVDSKVLLYIGVIEKRRHVDALIKALSKLPKTFVLLIVGNGGEKKANMELMKNLQIEDRVYFIPKQPQEKLPSIYNAADLFLLASDYEIYGMVILESMYYNVPVLSTKTGGARSLIKDNETGYLIDSLNSDEWAFKIKSIFRDTGLYSKVKNTIHNYVNNNLLWEKTCINYIDLYNKALDDDNKFD